MRGHTAIGCRGCYSGIFAAAFRAIGGLALALCVALLPALGAQEADRSFGENGEVYVLIADGDAGGVWAMNNLTAGTYGTGFPECLFDPTREPHTSIRGLKVDPARKIYFFKVARDPTFQVVPGLVRVRINTASPHRGHRKFTHEWNDMTELNHYGHFPPAEHPYNTESWRNGTGARIPAVPASPPERYVPFGYAAGDPKASDCSNEWYWVQNPVAYHSFVRSVTNKHIGLQDRVNMEDGVGSPSTSYYIFGETQYQRRNQYFLMDWQDVVPERPDLFSRQESLLGPGLLKAETHDLHIQREHVNGCHDGCTGGFDRSDYTSTPWLADVVVSMMGNDYFYKRQVGLTNGVLLKNGSPEGMPPGTVIGDPEDVTTCFVAVSSRDHETDWVYLLGDNVVKDWMSGSGMYAGDISADEVAVSDQWWQDGGIVYVLDKLNARVYKFRRDERLGDHGLPEEIPVPRDTDSIGSDGYGNLYYAVPEDIPSAPEQFVPELEANGGDIESISWTWVEPGVYSGSVVFRQEVTKTIYRFGYLSRRETVIGRLPVGFKRYTRPLMAEGIPDGGAPNQYRDCWQWLGPYALISSPDGTIRTEITAVNYAVPPKVDGFRPARLDIDGPYYADSLSGEIRPFEDAAWTGYREGEMYLFGVENFAVPDLNIENERYADRALNIKSGEGPEAEGLENTSLGHCLEQPVDNDGDGVIMGSLDYLNRKLKEDGSAGVDWKGGFPSTLDFRTLSYRWRLYQYRDRYGVDVTGDNDGDGFPDGPRVIYDNSQNSAAEYGWQRWPYLGLALDGGEYELRLEARYRWFNYDVLPTGSLACDRYSYPGVYLPPPDEPMQQAVAADGTTVARYRFHVQGAETGLTDKLGRIVCLDIAAETADRTVPEPLQFGVSWIIDEDRSVLWELQEAEDVPPELDRTRAMLQDRPPVPEGGLPRMSSDCNGRAASSSRYRWISPIPNRLPDRWPASRRYRPYR